MIFQSSGCQDPGPHFRSGGCLEKSISAFLRFSVTIYDTVTAVRPQSYLSVIRLIPKCYSNLSLGFKGTPRKRVSDCHRTETDNGGSVATLQLPRGSLAGCSSWRPRFALYSNAVNSIGGRPHGSGMVFALLALCGVFAAPRPCFPRISGCFSRLMTEMSIGFRLLLEALHLVQS